MYSKVGSSDIVFRIFFYQSAILFSTLSDGVVINGKWGDCEGEGCGIGEFQCTDGGDFNYDGKCVKRNSPIESAIIG